MAAAAAPPTAAGDARVAAIDAAIRVVPDFPKAGIMFHDVTTLLLEPAAFAASVDILAERYAGRQIDAVLGFEARGLIFGAPLALRLGVPFVPLRKPGKLPGAFLSAAYVTEYSTDRIEMHVGAVAPGTRCLLVDDLVATGGTLLAGAALVAQAGGAVVEAACVVEMPDLGGRAKLGGIGLFSVLLRAGD